ncbi:MAG: WYL domain-containing protein, partial [Aeriscardovia sp.]|nr:WYL domain-containing protein [Aeriscardovia sp.]
MAQRSSNGRRRFSDKGGKHELDVLAVLSSAFPQWLTSRQIAQRVKAYADSYGELADQAAKAAFAKQFQRDRAKLSAMGIVIESRQPEYSPKTDNQDFASYRLRLGNEPKIRIHFEKEDIPVLAVVNYFVQSLAQAEDFPADISKEPALGLDSIAPGLGIQKIPEGLIEALDSRKYTAAVEINGEKINVVYADSDDLATFMLEHPSSRILTPPVAREAYLKRLEAAVRLKVDESEDAGTHIPIEKRIRGAEKLHFVPQTESEVDRRLKLLLFLSAHMGTDYPIKDLALQFIGFANKEEEEEAVDLIKRDIGILSTVSDDGEIAGSQFFDVDWDLLEKKGIVKTTNSLGLERLAGIPPQYVALLAAGASYLSRSSFLSEEGRASADRLSNYLRQYASPGTVPWLSLTGCEVEPIYLPAIREIVRRGEGME